MPLETPFYQRSAQTQMTLNDHLAELRWRLMVCLATLAVCIVAGFWLSEPVIGLLKHVAPKGVQFVQLTPGEALMASFRIAVMVGVALASPVLLYHILRFVLPGLTPRERCLLGWIMAGGLGLFALGVWFAYVAVIPPALTWLLDYGQQLAATMMSLGRFVEFCTGFLLLGGLMFELPMVLLFLAMTGLVTSRQLVGQWRWAIVAIALAAGILTPSQDPISMGVVAIAMIALYGVSVIPIKLLGK